MEFLDQLFGAHWDLYAMSFFVGVMALLIFNYFSNRNQTGSSQPSNRQNGTHRTTPPQQRPVQQQVPPPNTESTNNEPPPTDQQQNEQ